MASTSRPRRPTTEPRSGGKIVRTRRTAAAKTPYDRPAFLPNSNTENPNWLSRLVFSPTRMIASGAGKLLTSVFTNDSSSSSSSDDDIDDADDDDDNDISSQATDTMKKNGALEMIQHARNESQTVVEKSETKHLIEQLLMQETFSREECNRLTNIIKSRVVHTPLIGDTEDGRLNELPNRTVGGYTSMPEICSEAIIEAKKWLEEKKLGSNSKSDLNLGNCILNSVMSPHATEGEAGSPVDMAKSYMRTRPPWASPSRNHIDYRSPSRTGMLFKEEAPYAIGSTSLSSSKMKRDSPASGSWNIFEEIRKVRSKATEEMLKNSSKFDWSAYASVDKNAFSSLADEAEASMRDIVQSSTKSVNVALNLSSGAATSHGFPVSQVAHSGLQKEGLSPNPTTSISEKNQSLMRDLEDIRTVDETGEGRLSPVHSSEDIKPVSQSEAGASNVDDLKGTNGTNQPLNSVMEGTIQVPESGLHDKNCSTWKEVVGIGGSSAANGFPTSGSSLSAGQDREENYQPSDEEEQDRDGLSHEKIISVLGEEACDLSEASMDVPIVYENDIVAAGSQNSPSMGNEELPLEGKKPNSKRSAAAAGKSPEKQQGKKLSRYNRRGRGRGK